jgi:hypothetical protein
MLARGNLIAASSELAGQRPGRDSERGNDTSQLRRTVTQPHLESGDGLAAGSEDGDGDRAMAG